MFGGIGDSIMRWRWWRTAAEMAADFTATRESQSDQNFIAACGLPDDGIAWETAIAVRRSVAAYGMVSREYIAISDRYPDELINLSGWDSLDFLAWILELEKELDEPVPPEAYAEIRTPFTVNDLVWAIYRHRDSQTKRPAPSRRTV
jgi:acyl carrier protein